MAITAPTNLAAVAASSSRINLSWSLPDTYDDIRIYRSTGGAYSQIGITLGSATSYSDTTCQDGTTYSYKLYVSSREDPPEGAWSNVASATTSLPAPSGLSGSSSAAGTQATLTWSDNSQNESGFKVYTDGSLTATVGPNVETYTVTSLTPGRTYVFTVKAYNGVTTSSASNSLSLLMADPPAAPSLLAGAATGTTTASLTWQDNADNEVDFKLERSATSASAGFSVIATISKNTESYADSGLTSNTPYWYRIRARNSSGYSAYSNVLAIVTWAAIAKPTGLTVVPISGTVIDIYFTDNSELEDYHCVEMKAGAGAYSEIVQLEPNRNAYRKTGLSAGTLYTFKVRAKQGASSYSDYSDEVAATTLSAPSAPTGLAVSEYQDTWVRIAWTAAATATGYKIQTSTTDAWGGEEVDVGTIPDDITEFKVTGLTAGTTYYFRICAYNGAGDSAWTASVSQATRSSYSRSKFEKLIRRPSPKLTYLVEGNPAVRVLGWALTSGKTYTYEAAFSEDGASISAMEENGVALTEQTSIANVESNAGSWYHDVSAGLVYVHPTASDDPANYYYVASFWVYLTTGRDVEFNGNAYLPLIADGGIPDISQAISPYFDNTFTISSGSIELINPKLRKTYRYDRQFGRYLWLNRKMRILAGGEGFTYAQFVAVNTGTICDYTCSDRRVVFNLRDLRDGLHRTLPVDRYTLDEFAALDESAADRVKQFWYGVATNIVPVCIDTTNRVFEFHAGRVKSVEYVYQNGTTLTANTDYFIDYQRGRIILARGLTYSSSDVILVDATCAVTDADEVIETGAHIYKHLLNNFLSVADTELDLDSIWATHLAKTTALRLGIWKETDSQELIRRVERSIQADSFQDAEGRLGLKVRLTSAPSDVAYIPNSFVMDDFEMERSQEPLYSTINVWYAEDPSVDKFSLVQASAPWVTYLHKVSKPLDVYTALKTSSDAATLASAIVDLLDKHPASFSVPRALFKHLPGDVFYLTRDRYYDQSGTANAKLMRILSISKQQGAGKTALTVEEV